VTLSFRYQEEDGAKTEDKDEKDKASSGPGHKIIYKRSTSEVAQKSQESIKNRKKHL
jgi:hypothetical protein